MRNILDFILRHSHWTLFVFLQTIAAFLLVRFNNFQGSVWFTSASSATASVTEVLSSVRQYFRLKEMNRELTERNVILMQEIEAYRRILELRDTIKPTPKLLQGMQTVVRTDSVTRILKAPPTDMKRDMLVCQAKVVNISVRRYDNFITINKGESSGVRTGMGVISGVGVVGIVCKTSENYSLVLPILNSNSSISCKLARTDYFGFLKWDGGNPLIASMTDVPRHAEYQIGDTIVTSGHSTVFIEGIPVGIVESDKESEDNMSYTLGIRLFTDFGRLNDVYVLALPPHDEIDKLEKDIKF